MRRSLLKCVKCRVSLVLCGVVKSVFIPQRQESKHETDLKMKLCCPWIGKIIQELTA